MGGAPATGGGQSYITDCNTGASPGIDAPGNNCYDAPDATVWYSFTTDATTATIDINLTSTDLTDPVFTVWTFNCPVTTYLGPLCGFSTVTGGSVNPNTTYYIAISDNSGTEGNFDLCIEQFDDQSACNTNDLITVTGTD